MVLMTRESLRQRFLQQFGNCTFRLESEGVYGEVELGAGIQATEDSSSVSFTDGYTLKVGELSVEFDWATVNSNSHNGFDCIVLGNFQVKGEVMGKRQSHGGTQILQPFTFEYTRESLAISVWCYGTAQDTIEIGGVKFRLLFNFPNARQP